MESMFTPVRELLNTNSFLEESPDRMLVEKTAVEIFSISCSIASVGIKSSDAN